MLQVRNLRCGYGSLEVIRGISFHVAAGEIVSLIGANGAGKTTVLNALAGLLPPWSGEVRLQGKDLSAHPPWRRVLHAMALVPEGRQVFGDMTVMENLLVGGYRNPQRRRAIDDSLKLFPRLRERAHQAAGTLSGGEQQMLALARALAAEPRLLLLDEPSMGLAPRLVGELFRLIRRLRDRGVTILLVEQNAVAALQISDRAYVLETGDIVMEGLAPDLSNNAEVRRAYLGKGYKEVWE